MQVPLSQREYTTLDNVIQLHPAAGGELVTSLKDAAERLREKDMIIAHLQAENARFRQREAELRNIFASGLTPGQKLSLLEVLRTCEKPDQPTDYQGRKRICLQTMAYHIGISDESIGKHVAKFAELGLIDKHAVKGLAPDGSPTSTIYVMPVEEKIRGIRTLTRPEAGNTWGGKRCPACNGTHLSIRRVITCLDCGNVAIDEKIQGEDEQPGSITPGREPEPHLAVTEKAPIPKPKNSALLNQKYPNVPHLSVSDGERKDHTNEAPSALSDEEALQREADLLLDLAGPSPEYIRMLWPGERKRDGTLYPETQKYITVHYPLDRIVTLSHLRGQQTIGATLQYDDDQARGICADGDDAAMFTRLQSAAVKLAAAGYMPLLEASPAQDSHAGGGHLWILFDRLVHARAAWAHILTLAPELEVIKERWPSNKRVRLPGGFYKRPAGKDEDTGQDWPSVAAWCTLTSVATGDTARNGIKAARLMLHNLTPASVVPDLPPEHKPNPMPPALNRGKEADMRAGDVDQRWQQKYGESNGFQVRFTAQQLIEAFNASHTLEEIHPLTTKTHARAIWRGEKDASVLYNDNGTWYDYGQHGTYPQHGDAFELWCLVTGKTKHQALIELGKAAAQRGLSGLSLATF